MWVTDWANTHLRHGHRGRCCVVNGCVSLPFSLSLSLSLSIYLSLYLFISLSLYIYICFVFVCLCVCVTREELKLDDKSYRASSWYSLSFHLTRPPLRSLRSLQCGEVEYTLYDVGLGMYERGPLDYSTAWVNHGQCTLHAVIYKRIEVDGALSPYNDYI